MAETVERRGEATGGAGEAVGGGDSGVWFGGPPKMACVMEPLLERCFSPPCAKKGMEDRIEELLGMLLGLV
uniref:Uncharacterized protein n=1 Tax=Oryza sativa subsp. japonica TaxID=39947 RepID=Q6YZ26_ORYSJ|nr:hypothetical protein [Oryza sativa Japonica Group]